MKLFHRKKLTNLITWEMHGISHQFPIVWENATKPTIWGEPGKLVIILFPQYEYFFPIRFPSYGILHHMGNAWVFPSISHSTKKSNKTHRMGRTWEIGTHTFPIARVLFSRQIPILWYSSLHGKCMGFLINFQQHGKIQQKPSNGQSLRNQFPYFFHSMGAFSIRFPSCGILHHMRNAWVSPSISHSTVKCNKTQGKAWEIGTHTFSIVWEYFSNQIPIL